jgi:riboflavin transporter FmnP
MKRWGIVITTFYAFIVSVLLVPVLIGLSVKPPANVSFVFKQSLNAYVEWPMLIWVGIIAGGQALLFFLSVDTSWRHTKPRRHIAISATLASFFAAVLMWSALGSILVSVYGDKPIGYFKRGDHLLLSMLGFWIGLWVIWGGVFYVCYRNSSNMVSRVVTWLLRGSVLELLIAVPAHVIVRQRGDCSAPVVTGFGIVTGLAIMLLCFGPGVLALYKKRLDSYSRNARNPQAG